MKHLQTLITILFISNICYSQSDSLVYQGISIRASYFLDSLGIVYMPTDIRCDCDVFTYNIPDSMKQKFIESHPDLEYLPNQHSPTYILSEYVEMFGGESESIGDFVVSTYYDKVIGHSDFNFDNFLVRIIETKTESFHHNKTHYYFFSSVYVMDKNGVWTEVWGDINSVPESWYPFYLVKLNR